MIEVKICTKCKEYKQLNEYYKDGAKAMGVKSACKPCTKPIQQKHYQNNKDKYRHAYKEFILRNPSYMCFYQRNHN